jgi:hypothetical protein
MRLFARLELIRLTKVEWEDTHVHAPQRLPSSFKQFNCSLRGW